MRISDWSSDVCSSDLLAVETGGNCELSQPGKVVEHQGVKIVGHLNVPSRLAADASALYARNIYNFIELLVDKDSKQLAVNWEDKIVADTCIIRDGKIVHPALAPTEEERKSVVEGKRGAVGLEVGGGQII